MLDQQVHPSNAIAVKPLEVNPEIQLSKQERANEKDLRYIGNAVCAAGKCLAYLMDMLADAEIILRRHYPDDHGWLVWDDFTFDFAKANKLIANAMKMLGMANVQTGQARRLLLVDRFKPDFQKLCDKNNFEGGNLFGLNLNAATSLISDANHIQYKAFESKPQRSRGRGRGGRRWDRRSTPYNSQSFALQAAVLQQALASATPQFHQQFSGPTTGGMFGVNQFPQAPNPLMGFNTLSTAPHLQRGRGHRRRSRRGRGRGHRRTM